MRTLDLALKDLLQIIRDRKSLFFLLIMPIVFTLFFGWVFGNAGEPGDPRLPVAVLNQDPGQPASITLEEFIARSDAVRLEEVEDASPETLPEMVADGAIAAAVIIPAGYSDSLLAGEDVSLTLIVDPGSQSGGTAQRSIEAAVTRLRGAVTTAQISTDTYAAQKGFAGDAERQAYLVEALALASAAWAQPPISAVSELAVAASEEDDALPANAFAQSSPGMMVQFAVFGLLTASMVLVIERRSGALQRLMTTPIRQVEVIAGHVLAMFVMVFAQETILIVIGQFAFGLGYFDAPVATLAMMAALAFWAASLGLLIGALAKTEDHVVTLSLLAMFLFSALGGAWFPLDITGEAFSKIGHLMPTAWAMDGFQNIIIRGMGLNSVMLPAGIIMAYGVVFFGLAVWRFKFE